jgi:hypothetical protein
MICVSPSQASGTSGCAPANKVTWYQGGWYFITGPNSYIGTIRPPGFGGGEPKAPMNQPTPTPPSPPGTGTAPGATPPPAWAGEAWTTVQTFYGDINSHDYGGAWGLFQGDVTGQTYDQFVAGYATTASVSVTENSDFISGPNDTVDVTITATENDGTVHTYAGTYTVNQPGYIIGANIQQTG